MQWDLRSVLFSLCEDAVHSPVVVALVLPFAGSQVASTLLVAHASVIRVALHGTDA